MQFLSNQISLNMQLLSNQIDLIYATFILTERLDKLIYKTFS